MAFEKNAHCSFCGHLFEANLAWPRRCAACGQISFVNPIPVVVVLLPVDDGLLVVRRGIEPQRGKLALPGGYIDLGESWQAAGAREVFEETGVRLDPDEIVEFRVRSTADGVLLIFGLAHERTSGDLPEFQPSAEATECRVLRQAEELAFPWHTSIVREFFDGRNKNLLNQSSRRH